MTQDIVRAGIAGGWDARDGATLNGDLQLEADVAIVGTGAGGGMAAEVFANAGLKVVMIEEGPLQTSSDFKMQEAEAYPRMYQEQAARKTKDKAINILQGRSVGGSTTINWTSSFATPDQTLNHWTQAHNVKDCTPEQLEPWFDAVKTRLNITKWEVPPNPNNDALRIAAEKLGWEYDVMHRNVINCINSGFCGVGCPVNAKQSMLITTIPTALKAGATLIYRCLAEDLEHKNGKVSALLCRGLDAKGLQPSGHRVRVTARHYVLAGGAINTPALLMRAKAPDPQALTGKRTFLHPVSVTVAVMPDRVDPYYGAPQSIYTDQFMWRDGVTGKMGYKIECPPMHPLLSATVLGGHGSAHARLMAKLPYMQTMLALGRDGFSPESIGGTVNLRSDGTPLLDYPLTESVWDYVRHSFSTMMEAQWAAGAVEVMPMHRDVVKPFKSWKETKAALADMRMEPLVTRIFSAHVMGGCLMGEDPQNAVVNSKGRHHHLENVSVIDGSVFPTSIGSNPQVSIYGMSLKNATKLAESL